jgi:hypothetical protein
MIGRDQARLLAAANPAALGYLATSDEPLIYRPAAFHRLIAEHIIDVEQGRLDVLILQVPVQHGKSELASVLTSAWFLGIHPERYVTAVSYAAEFAADRIGRPARNFLERHGGPFFGVHVAPDSSARNRWNTTVRGGLATFGIEQGITGRRSDLLIVDDPYAGLEQAMSKRHRDLCWHRYQFEIATRLSPTAGQIHIMSRWSTDDHVGRLIQHLAAIGLRYRVVDFPALAICSTCADPGIEAVNQCGHGVCDELGRMPGEALWPEVRPREFLLRQRKLVGPRAFAALYQGRPIPDTGDFFEGIDLAAATETFDGEIDLSAITRIFVDDEGVTALARLYPNPAAPDHEWRLQFPSHRYIHAWDLADKRDWTVGSTWDLTTKRATRVEYERFQKRGWSYVYERIRDRQRRYGGKTYLDLTGVGDPVGEELSDIGAEGINFAGKKNALLENWRMLLSTRQVRWPEITEAPDPWADEHGWYSREDDGIVTDCVMSGAIAGWFMRRSAAANAPASAYR